MKTFKHLILAVFSCFIMVSCGDKKDKKKEGFSYENKAETTNEVKNDINDVVITANDAMQFNKKEIRVKAGAPVKITLKHLGKMDKNVMGHNFVLLKSGTDLVAFGNKAATSKETEYIPEAGKDVIAHTKLIGGGETAVVEFEAPAKGTYEFLCSFPGHYAIMKGTFIVE
ncbi:azurin [Tamlana fucoidanivorans]|uniref:Azurin n=1 Tax=Allotamlana fucoidanivorans TaxID=2583814 RepID=A0A5C4SKC3_9FLAO|nr:azurin [Tamlana fucoidanivorans]TNJ43685.1 azurin [Tamlana fucoidanivorans]